MSRQEGVSTVSLDKILAYFEIKVILGGFYDQIAIGLTNNPDFPL